MICRASRADHASFEHPEMRCMPEITQKRPRPLPIPAAFLQIICRKYGHAGLIIRNCGASCGILVSFL
jgi:hypothetical protein